jgi:hypothetical protein
MKKSVLFVFVFLFMAAATQAQVFILGGKGLLNYTTFMNDNANIGGNKLDKVFTLGGQGGIYFRYYFNEATYYSNTNFSLCVELLYGGFGQKYKGNYSDTLSGYSFNSKISASSLEVPVMLHIRGQAGLYAEFGVSFGMINGVKQDFTRSPEDASFPNISGASVDSSYMTNNLSGIFGFGIDSELSDQLNLTIGFRLTYGISDFSEPQKNFATDYTETHTATVGFIVGLGYIINFYHDHH